VCVLVLCAWRCCCTHTRQLGKVAGVAGQAFFVTNGAPLPFWDFLSAVLTGFGYHAPRSATATPAPALTHDHPIPRGDAARL
jgi:hypothetical protein